MIIIDGLNRPLRRGARSGAPGGARHVGVALSRLRMNRTMDDNIIRVDFGQFLFFNRP